jgi:two-component system CheB/CheR fusion protein
MKTPVKTVKKGHDNSSVKRRSKLKPLTPIDGNEIDFPVIGIGGSAGSFEPLEKFFRNTPSNIGMAFIIVMHLDPTKKGMMPELLQHYTKMKVTEAKDGEIIQKNHVYIIPPAKDISILNGGLLLLEPTKPRGLRMPIDFFFQSLGVDQGERAGTIILSGMGSDGELGMKVVKEYLGMAMVQDPSSAEFSSMPQASISSGFADYILLPEDMPEKLISYFHHPVIKQEDNADILDSKTQNALMKIFMLLRTQTGHDFSMYKRSTINRRIDRRIAVHQLSGIIEYVNYLRENAHEIDVLFKELLIGVTKFFRDSEAFEELENTLMKTLKSKKATDTVRVWVAGCSTGEEAYSIAILLIECMEKLKMKDRKVQVFATDLDAAAIEKARTGIYFDNLSGDVSVDRLERYFIHQNNHYIVKKEVRELIIFAQHNLIKDSPFTKLDLLCCRNLLIYLNTDLQKKLMPLFHYSLNKDGLLFLGNSETIGHYIDLFSSVNSKLRIFARKEGVSFSRLDYPFGVIKHDLSVTAAHNDLLKTNRNTLPEIFQNILLERYTPPSVIMNEKGDVLYVNGSLGKFAEIGTGEPNMNIHKIAKKAIRYELSNLISKCTANKSTQVREGLTIKMNETPHMVRITCAYLKEPSPLEGLIMMVFEDLGIQKEVKLERTMKGNKEDDIIFELEKDLSRTREQLENTIHQMETSFEELKSTNEELQSTNEELQSTNEEAITSKEEMQSMNEELMTINMQYQAKSEEVALANNDMRNLMDSMEVATVFLNNDLVIKRFTPKAAEIIKLISSDVGRPLLHLSSSIVYKDLEKDMKEVLRKLVAKEITIPAKKNIWYSLRITPYRTNENYIEGIVLTFIDITKLKELEAQLNFALQSSEDIVNSIKDALVVIDKDLNVVSINKSFSKTFKLSNDQAKGYNIFKLAGWNILPLKKAVSAINAKKPEFTDLNVIHKFPALGNKSMVISGKQILSKNKDKKLLLLTIRIVPQKKG